MQTILVQGQPDTKTDCGNPAESRNFPVIDTAETDHPCDAAPADSAPHADHSRVPAIGETGSPQALPFVLQFLVMREERPADELAEPVRHTSEAPADACSATKPRSKEPGNDVPAEERWRDLS